MKKLREAGFTQIKSGFTLIELLVVIAVIGVLAGALIVAINPSEQLARSRDTGRKRGIQQLGTALAGYNLSTSSWPIASNVWMNALIASGDLKARVKQYPSVYSCSGTYGDNNYCFATIGNDAYTMVALESTVEKDKCPTGDVAFYVWMSRLGRSGVVCFHPPFWSLSSYVFVN